MKLLKLSWCQGLIGPESPVVSAYGATAIPATFLIGPDGKILAKDLRGDAARKTVAKALRKFSRDTIQSGKMVNGRRLASGRKYAREQGGVAMKPGSWAATFSMAAVVVGLGLARDDTDSRVRLTSPARVVLDFHKRRVAEVASAIENRTGKRVSAFGTMTKSTWPIGEGPDVELRATGS